MASRGSRRWVSLPTAIVTTYDHVEASLEVAIARIEEAIAFMPGLSASFRRSEHEMGRAGDNF
jgi:hypothetical protein